MAGIIEKTGLTYHMRIKARFGMTVAALVREGLGVAILDQFTMAEGWLPGLKVVRIAEPTVFETFIAAKANRPLSRYAQSFVDVLREEMRLAAPESNPGRPTAATITSGWVYGRFWSLR